MVKTERPINFAKLARDLGTTKPRLKKSIEWHRAVDKSTVRMSGGRPKTETGATEREIAWSVNEMTLRHQVGCSL